ncbi:MAG: AMP-binding protein [bacterium]|nr:AMP-binding protein [bacterium]
MNRSPFYQSLRIRAKYFPPETAAVIFGDLRITWKEQFERVNRLANALAGLGLKKGDKCAFLFHNCPEFLEINLAIQALGAVPVPVNYRYVKSEVEYLLDNSDSVGFFFEEEFLPLVKEIRGSLSKINFYVIKTGRYGQKPIVAPPPGLLHYEDLLRSGSPSEPRVEVGMDDLAVLMYTGGTTGRSKGVMLTYRNFISNQFQITSLLTNLLPPVSTINDPIYARNESERKIQGAISAMLGQLALLFENPAMKDKVMVVQLIGDGSSEISPITAIMKEGKVKLMTGAPEKYDLRVEFKLGENPSEFLELSIYPYTLAGKLALIPKILKLQLSGRFKIQGKLGLRMKMAALNFRNPPTTDFVRALPASPFFHLASYAIWLLFLCNQKGAAIILQNQSFDPAEVLDLVEKEKVTWIFMVPTMWKKLVDAPGIEKRNLSSVKIALTGAAVFSDVYKKKLLSAFRETLLVDAFGQTEMAPVTTAKVDGDADAVKDRSVGKLLNGVEAKIVNDQGEPVKDGEVGELLYKSPSLMKGYYKDQEKTDQVITKDGWFRSGDLAKRAADGEIYVVERKGECINSGGEKIFPLEVEDFIHAHPKVADVCVIGVADEQWGQIIRAVVVLKPGEKAAPEEIIDFCKDKMASYKKPRQVVFVDALPLSPVGKVLRAKIKEQWGQPNK